jgi:IclR family acetate operon transcriptional repressor
MARPSAGKRTKREAAGEDAQTVLGTRAIRRTCLIVREVAAAGNLGASLPALVTATAMPKSSVHRYLEVLVQQGFVERDLQSGTYRLGAQLVSLGSNESQMLAQRARPFLERLRDRFDETVNLGVLSGDSVVYLDIIESARAVRLAARPGDRDFVHSTALGKAIAAGLPKEDIRQLLERTGLPRRTANTITRIQEFMRHLELVQRQGYALDDQENDVDGRCVAVAIPGPRVHYAISVSGITSRFPMSKTVEAAREVREAISEFSAMSIDPIRPRPS